MPDRYSGAGALVGRGSGNGAGDHGSYRPWCPLDCGCRLGPDALGRHDADLLACTCDGPCTAEG